MASWLFSVLIGGGNKIFLVEKTIIYPSYD